MASSTTDEDRKWAKSVADDFSKVVRNAVEEADEQQSGTAILTCRNHPTYRWTKTKYGPGFIGSGVLMFDGEEGGKPSSPFNMSEGGLRESALEYQEHFRERYTPECDCPVHDLVFLAWA